MGHKKVTDDEILYAIARLNRRLKEKMYHRGFDNFNPGHRRHTIQKEVFYLTGQTYSDSGFRNRLKKLVADEVLHKERISEYVTMYSLKRKHYVATFNSIKKDHRRLAGVF